MARHSNFDRRNTATNFQTLQDVSTIPGDIHVQYILSFIRNDLDLPRKLIKIIIALDAAQSYNALLKYFRK